MRKVLAVLAVLAFGAVVVPAQAWATTGVTSQEDLAKKKKKKEAELKKAEEKKKAEAKKKAQARKQAEAKRRAEEKKKAAALAEKKKQRREARAGGCTGLMECLFGKPRRSARYQTASTGGGKYVEDYATGEDIDWPGASKYAVGSIVVSTPDRSLYLVTGPGEARRYKVGVGREGFQWSGNSTIVAKQEWPDWRPPQVMIEREAAKGHIIPEFMEGGPENPLGARALYIGGTIFRIHGTNNAASIGGAVSSGCIRMMNTDVMELYDRVKIGSRVYVYQ